MINIAFAANLFNDPRCLPFAPGNATIALAVRRSLDYLCAEMRTIAMSDIRPTLRERLHSIRKEIEELQTRIQRLADLEKSIAAALAHEDALHSVGNGTEPELALNPSERRSLSYLIVKALGAGPRDLDELKRNPGLRLALKDSLHPGRAINFALVGLQKGRHVERLNDGSWQLVSGESQKETEAPR
jgi:hypothetical protein